MTRATPRTPPRTAPAIGPFGIPSAEWNGHAHPCPKSVSDPALGWLPCALGDGHVRKCKVAGSVRASASVIAAERALARLAEIAGTLRETATGLRVWARRDDKSDRGVNPWHAAERLERLAEEISAKRSAER